MTTDLDSAQTIFRRQGGLLHTAEALRLGIAPRTLYTLRDTGTVTELARGLYRLADLPPLGEPDLVTVALKVPKAVICLISALAFHNLTTQIPHAVYLALPYSTTAPRLRYPPVKVCWLSGQAFTSGVRTHQVDGVTVRVYEPEKTVADCFKFRNKIGPAVAIEGLKRCAERADFRLDRLVRYARLNRVERAMHPYLEMLA